MAKESNNQRNLDEILEEDRKKLKLLENIVATIYNKRVSVTEDGEYDVNFTPSEVSQLIAAEEKLMELRRKVNGMSE